MKLPSDETPSNHLNGDDYLSDEYEELIPAPITNGDFSEYMWMENEEEFDSEVGTVRAWCWIGCVCVRARLKIKTNFSRLTQVLRQLEEEELMEECIVAMLNDEEASFEESSTPGFESNNNSSTANNSRNSNDILNSSVNGLSDSVNNLSLSSNGVRNNGTNDHADNTHGTTQPSTVRYTAQDRL